jgi:hypothetical protein
VLRPLAKLNVGKVYAQQIKPFNFILSCHVAALGQPSDANAERFHLIAPYERDPRKWLALPWIEQYSGKHYRISTTLATGTRQIARVKNYGDVLEEYEFHEEAKCADASGTPCGKQTVGAAAAAARDNRVAAALHRQGIEQARRGRGGKHSGCRRRLHGVS